jgi:hypothetical protein
MLLPAIICWELLTFGILAMVFVFIQDKLPGKRQIKGLLYGLPFAGLYLIGMFESVLLFDSSMFNEFLMGLGDFIPILLMGILLGIFAGTDNTQIKQKNDILSIFIISIFYITGRYFAYSLLHIQSAYITRPIETFIWTLFQGLCVGTIFFNLQSGIKGNSVVSQSLYFGLVIFGSNWLMNHLFIAVVAELSADLFIRAGTDILFVMTGVYTYKKLFSKSHYIRRFISIYK